MKNLRYVLHPNDFRPVPVPAKIIFISSVGTILGNLPVVVRALGPITSLKSFLRIVQGRRAIALLLADSDVPCHLLVTYGFCRDWPIEDTAAVIGRVGTLPRFRGKGLATQALMQSLACIFKNPKVTRVYIDTAEDNISMQRVIAKCGFGGPTLTYDRKARRAPPD